MALPSCTRARKKSESEGPLLPPMMGRGGCRWCLYGGKRKIFTQKKRGPNKDVCPERANRLLRDYPMRHRLTNPKVQGIRSSAGRLNPFLESTPQPERTEHAYLIFTLV